MVDFSLPYSVKWNIYKVNVDTWDESSSLPGVVSVSLDRDCSDDVPLLESSSMSFDSDLGTNFEDGYYRVIADFIQGSSFERHPITTQLYQSSSVTYDYGIKQWSIDGQSVLLPASEIYMRDGSYVPKNSNGGQWALNQLRSTIKAPVYMDGDGFYLKRHVVYDSNDSVLSAVWGVLDAGKWCIRITGNGVVMLTEKPKNPSLILNESNLRILHPEIKSNRSKRGIPNRYIVRYGTEEIVMTNDDPDSETSTVNVGRYIDAPIDANPYLMVGESPYEYAKRKLEEVSTIRISYDYTREYYPDIYPMSIVSATLPRLGLDGDLRVVQQKLTLDTGIYVNETAYLEHKFWKVV